MAEQTDVQDNSTKTQILKIVRWVVVSVGVALVLFTFIMAIVRKYGG